MTRRAKASQLVVLAVLAFSFFLSRPFSWGFELFTHEDLTDAAFDRSAPSDALRDLGIDPERQLNGRGSRRWLVKGARDEDDTISANFARYRNHFYAPVNNRG